MNHTVRPLRPPLKRLVETAKTSQNRSMRRRGPGIQRPSDWCRSGSSYSLRRGGTGTWAGNMLCQAAVGLRRHAAEGKNVLLDAIRYSSCMGWRLREIPPGFYRTKLDFVSCTCSEQVTTRQISNTSCTMISRDVS